MKVAFDISPLGLGYRNPGGRTGVYRVVDRLARGLAASPDCDLTLVAAASFEALRESIAFVEATPALRPAPIARRSLLGTQIELERALRRLNASVRESGSAGARQIRSAAREGVSLIRKLIGGSRGPLDRALLDLNDVYHSPFFPLPEPSGRAQRVLTCHDLIPIRQPHLVLPDHRQFLEQILESLRPTDWVICVSEWVREDLCDYLRFDRARTFVTHWAADPELFYCVSDRHVIDEVRARYGIPGGPYFLSVATLEPRRNVRHLVECFATLLRDQRIPDLSLVLVGNKGWGLNDLLQAIERDPAVRGRVVVTGFARDEDLAPLYSGASAFVYPSLADGFGLTPLEAMQCGVPVIVSNRSSLPEVVGDAAIQVDPTDAAGLCQAMLSVHTHEGLRNRLAAKSLARSRQFNWSKSVQDTVNAYRVAIGGRA